MNMNDCKIIINLSELGSFTRCAKYMFTSQPSLTYRIKKIEEEFNTKIFKRDNDGVSLTYDGEIILESAKKILAVYETTMKRLNKSNDNDISGSFTIGISTIFSKSYFAKILRKYQLMYPHVDVSFITASSTQELPDLYRTGKIDLAIARGDANFGQYKNLILMEPFYIISAENLNLDNFINYPLIKYNSDINTDFYQRIYNWFKSYYKSDYTNKPIKTNSIESAINLTIENFGWCVLTETSLPKHHKLKMTPLVSEDGEPISVPTSIIYSDKSTEDMAQMKFIELTKEMLKTIAKNKR